MLNRKRKRARSSFNTQRGRWREEGKVEGGKNVARGLG
jgi:hypothetical protein